ncbi:MAG: hypothetical protein LBV43_02155 [Prevotella sp.]|nr:hypothetical protein [Prevotella sp.]
MTIKEYIDAIANVESSIVSKGKLVVELFNAAGSVKAVKEDTANSWINGERHCQIRRYFPDGQMISPEKFVKYFEKRGLSYTSRLQQAFISINADGIVKCATNDMGIFLRSLTNQFASIYDLQWPYELPDDTNDTSVSQDGASSKPKPERLSDIYDENYEGYGISDFIHCGPLYLTPDRIRDAICFLGSVGYGNRFSDAEHQEGIVYLDNDEDVFRYINNYYDTLSEYISCLKKHSMGSPGQFPDSYKPPDGSISDFIKEVDSYQQKLESLSRKIEGEIYSYKSNQLNQIKSAYKKMWEENSRTNVF